MSVTQSSHQKVIQSSHQKVIQSSHQKVIQSSHQKVMSFAEIIQGRDATVRVTHDGMLYAVDLVMVMTGLWLLRV
jgi:hypothetical protein